MSRHLENLVAAALVLSVFVLVLVTRYRWHLL